MLTFLTGGRLRTKVDLAIVGVRRGDAARPRRAAAAVPRHRRQPAADPGQPALRDPPSRRYSACCSRRPPLAAVVVVAIRFVAASGPGRRALLPSIAGAACLVLFVALILRDLVLGFRLGVVGAAGLGGGDLDRRPCRWSSSPGCCDRGWRAAGWPSCSAGSATCRPTSCSRRWRARSATRRWSSPSGSRTPPTSTPAAHPWCCPEPGGDRSVTPVERDGTPVAALVYDRSLDDDPELVEAVGAAATIALENRHLQAEAQARLTELRASRERIIAAGDAERRRIERNLHDGAQQRLVLLAMQLSEIQRRIRADPSGAEQLVTSASDELARSLTELRELASGIHPSSLDHGLDVALEALVPALGRAHDGLRGARPPPARAGRVRRLLRDLRGADQHRQVRAGDLGVGRRRPAGPAGWSSRSPTTASAAPTRPGAPACAASTTGSRRSAAPCAWATGRRAAPSWRLSYPSTAEADDRGPSAAIRRRPRRPADGGSDEARPMREDGVVAGVEACGRIGESDAPGRRGRTAPRVGQDWGMTCGCGRRSCAGGAG